MAYLGSKPANQVISSEQIADGVISTADLANNAVTYPKLSSDLQRSGLKNRIINGAMVIDQRNAGASVTPTTSNTYTIDRWKFYLSQASKFSVQQNAGSVTPPTGFTNYLGITSTSAYTVGAAESFLLSQAIEGYNVADLGWGTANAKTVTLSFQVYSSLTGTFGGALGNSAGNRSYPFTYSIPVANTWTTVSVTIPGDTTGTWLGGNAGGIFIYFNLGCGATYSGAAWSWSSNLYVSATGATSVVGTNGATFYITGVQLEVGSSATGYEYRQYGQELALCQRYYENGSCKMYATGLTAPVVIFQNYRITKRATATLSYSAPPAGGYNAPSSVEWSDITGFSGNSGTQTSLQFSWTASAEL